jgi:hypothetical protein
MPPDRIRSAPSGGPARAQDRPSGPVWPAAGPDHPSGRTWPGRGPGLRVLGPLVLRGPTGRSSWGGVKPRRLLAALTLNAGRVISADQLIDIA